MDREAHDFFHTHIRRIKDQTGRWPSFEDQVYILKKHFDGVVLSDALELNRGRYPKRKLEKFMTIENENRAPSV